MKKIILTFVVFAFVANVCAQLEVDSSGNTHVVKNILLGGSNSFLGTTNDIPLTFKVNNTLAGYIGKCEYSNTSFGYEALKYSAPDYANTAVGANALYLNTGGFLNTANGTYALYSNITGESNTAIGAYALLYNMGGCYNTANGSFALCNNTGGCYNTANGFAALNNNKTGELNTANGHLSLNGNKTGDLNTAVGYYADVNASNLTNATAIGYGALALASDQVVLGNTSITSFKVGTSTTTYSDGRAKRNIRAEVPGLSFVNQLQPVMYNFNLDALDELQKSDDPKINAFRDSIRNARTPKQKEMEAKSRAKKEKIVYSGFIAQDVEKAAQSVGYDFSGVDAPENGKGPYGLRYAEFVVPLVKAVQELSGQNDRLIETVKEQQIQIEELKAEMKELKGNGLRSTVNETETTEIADAVVAQCKLYQNAPNPFNQNTQIRFYIPENVNVAQLCIYNLQGTEIKQILITQRGESSQWISGSELSAGMYLYALIVDGKEVDVKRMILTK